MGQGKKLLLGLILGLILGVILLTWGSVGSAVLTLGLLLGLGILPIRWFLERDNGEFQPED